MQFELGDAVKIRDDKGRTVIGAVHGVSRRGKEATYYVAYPDLDRKTGMQSVWVRHSEIIRGIANPAKLSKERQRTIALTIMGQIGKLTKAQIGAHGFTALDTGGLGMLVKPYGGPQALRLGAPNKVVIHLQPDDLYTLRYYHIANLKFQETGFATDVRVDELNNELLDQLGYTGKRDWGKHVWKFNVGEGVHYTPKGARKPAYALVASRMEPERGGEARYHIYFQAKVTETKTVDEIVRESELTKAVSKNPRRNQFWPDTSEWKFLEGDAVHVKVGKAGKSRIATVVALYAKKGQLGSEPRYIVRFAPSKSGKQTERIVKESELRGFPESNPTGAKYAVGETVLHYDGLGWHHAEVVKVISQDIHNLGPTFVYTIRWRPPHARESRTTTRFERDLRPVPTRNGRQNPKLGPPMKCYGQVNQGLWCQEWYESSSRDAGRRTRQLRKLGYDAVSSAMGEQVTDVGRVKMTLVDIRPGARRDTLDLPKDNWELVTRVRNAHRKPAATRGHVQASYCKWCDWFYLPATGQRVYKADKKAAAKVKSHGICRVCSDDFRQKTAQHLAAKKVENPGWSRAAKRMAELFNDAPARRRGSVSLEMPKALTHIGPCAQVDYISQKWGRGKAQYYHTFEGDAQLYALPKPMPDGRSALLILGDFQVKPEGITG